MAGVDVTRLARLEQRAGGGASKGQLMTALDRQIGELDLRTKSRVLNYFAEEIVAASPTAPRTFRSAFDGWAGGSSPSAVDRRGVQR